MLTDSLIFKGGIVMIPIILGSIVALAIVVSKINYFLSIKTDIDSLIDRIHSMIRNGDIEQAVTECEKTKHPLGRIFKAGIQSMDKDRTWIERAMERTGNIEIASAEKYMLLLVIIIGVEPMLGFLGTIMGLIQSFMAWEKLGGSVTVDFLAAGIYQAMITTAGGLIVAIPYYIIYHVFVGRINRLAQLFNHQGEELIDLIQETRKGSE